ncbi:MAG: nucleotide exchange factor GrpE [Firmicutes bacterium]|nr:nucleotide exchange factor GrpE [Bacillota bacterium]
MSKNSDKHLALWEAWLGLKEAAEYTVTQSTNELFENYQDAACDALKRSAARLARFGEKDEEMYEPLVKLMGVYQQVVDMGSEIEQDGSVTAALVTGLCEVLNSTLKQFYEDTEGVPDGINPIALEKEMIIRSSQANLLASTSHFGKVSMAMLRSMSPEIWDELYNGVLIPPGKEVPVNFFKDHVLMYMYSFYEDELRRCVLQLDNIHDRKDAKHYTEFLEREWEELGNIIKVQIAALESAASESEMVHHILNMLREAYQYTGAAISKFHMHLQSPVARKENPAHEEFDAAMESAVTEPIIPELPRPYDHTVFYALICDEVLDLLEDYKIEFIHVGLLTQKLLITEKMMADEIIQIFDDVRKALPSLSVEDAPVELSQEDAQLQLNILNGISETVEIKVDSLRDNTEIFVGGWPEFLDNSIAEEPLPLTWEERCEIREVAYQIWVESPPESDDIKEFFYRLQTDDIFTPLFERMFKRINAHIEKVDKFVTRFNKDVLIYEICTYEEILMHSASRLRESAWADMAAAENILVGAYSKIEALLEKHDIVPIRPAVHDQFNALEHEILVAESQEGFAKGEIIKLINSGYKHHGFVFRRANVIAAK